MTDTKRLTVKTSGKVIQTDYDFILEQSGACWYCLTDAQVQMILSIVDFFGWPTRWYSESGTVDLAVITELKAGLVEALMNDCCGDNDLIYRFAENGHYQSSADGGVTWEDAPNADPRAAQPVYPPFLPPGTVDNRCTYADGLVKYIKQGMVDQMESSQTAAEIGSSIIGLLTGIGAALTPTIIGPIIIAILGAVLAYIVAHSVDAFKAAMTSEVYARLKCNFFDNMAVDGSLTQAKVDAIYNRIGTEETGVAALFLRAIIAGMGPILMTNAARQGMGDPVATCEDCSDLCGTAWTFYGVYDVVMVDENHYTMRASGGGAHFAFSSGSSHIGCYWDIPLLFEGSNVWYVDGPGPVPATGATRTTKVWNFDTGDLGAGTPISLTFSSKPISH